jgi:hypothetical protein
LRIVTEFQLGAIRGKFAKLGRSYANLRCGNILETRLSVLAFDGLKLLIDGSDVPGASATHIVNFSIII